MVLEALLITCGFSTASRLTAFAFANVRYTKRLDTGGPRSELCPEFVKFLLDTFSGGRFYKLGLANTQMCRAIVVSPLTAKIIDLQHFFFRDQFKMDTLFPARNEPLSWGFRISQRAPLALQTIRKLLVSTRPLYAVLGRHILAVFAFGVHFVNALTYDSTGDEFYEDANAVIEYIESALPADVFDRPIEIHVKREWLDKLDEGALTWADAIMSNTVWPILRARKGIVAPTAPEPPRRRAASVAKPNSIVSVRSLKWMGETA